MNITEYDFYIYRELLRASKNYICKQLPPTVTNQDLNKLCNLGLCDDQTTAGIILTYNEDDLLELEKQFYHQRQEKADKDAAKHEERAYLHKETQHHFRHDWWILIVGAIINFALGAISDHFFDIVGNAVNALRSLIP